MTTVVTRGAASAQALGYASSSAAVNYIEDVFSTYLYTGNGSTQTITNGIDLSGKGGLVWIKSRTAANLHNLVDTNRGANLALDSSTTLANWNTASGGVTSFNSTGFSLGNFGSFNGSGANFASWTFRKQPKFFDVVTYTGDGVAGRTVAHALGSVPGCMIVKNTSNASNWSVYHRSTGATDRLILNLTNATGANNTIWNDTAPTSTVFTVGDNAGVNASGQTYVAYLFAHNAGGFGLTGTDNVISCGSFTSDIAGLDINLGYEPQWVMVKVTNGVGLGWYIWDSMRGFPVGTGGVALQANVSDAESATGWISPTATGFKLNAGQLGSGNPFIYIAIRRGPMKVPTDATNVFSPQALNSPANGTQVTTGFPVDLSMFKSRAGGPSGQFQDRLRGLPSTAGTGTPALYPDATAAESTNQTGYEFWNTGYRTYTAQNAVWWMFRRAPGFFDEVCYSGTGSATTQTHNLAAVPELMIIKARNSTFNWTVKRNASLDYAVLNSTQAFAGGFEAALWNSTEPTSSVFSLGTNASVNGSGYTYVAYLFATVAGVSKVGTYTGTGTTLQINCGFTAGSRFVLIKRTDSTGDWYVWDSARGIVAGNDPYLLLNSTAAEVTGTDYVDTYSAGFEISSTAPAAINANGGSFIFLAIA
jgi:hypothetical protein